MLVLEKTSPSTRVVLGSIAPNSPLAMASSPRLGLLLSVVKTMREKEMETRRKWERQRELEELGRIAGED